VYKTYFIVVQSLDCPAAIVKGARMARCSRALKSILALSIHHWQPSLHIREPVYNDTKRITFSLLCRVTRSRQCIAATDSELRWMRRSVAFCVPGSVSAIQQ